MTDNANLTISSDVVRMLGRKLYSSHPLIIVTRELLQNSVDACNRRGVNPEIEIVIDIDNENQEIFLSCKDNGEGMTSDVLINKFLCLGASGKRDNKGGTGGFGIAKAAIMSNKEWEVHTHNLHTSSETLGQPLKNVKYLDGTKVSVKIDEKWNQSNINDTIKMIYLSDVKVHLTLIINSVLLLDDKKAGLRKSKKLDETNNGFNVSLLETFLVGDGIAEIKKTSAIRLNGLVQFVQSNWVCDTNLIYDLKIDKDILPTDNRYPLSMSRESIQTNLSYQIRNSIDSYNQNPLSTAAILTDDDDKKIKVNKGINLSGDNKRLPTFPENATLVSREVPNFQRIQSLENLPAIGGINYIVVFRDSKPTTEEKRILRLWAAILSLTAKETDIFGVGITGQESEGAARMYENGHDYYVLNTKKILEEDIQTMDEMIHRLHFLATHEATHYEQGSHNEIFTSKQCDYYNDSIKAILDNMPKLRTIIRNNY